MRMASEEAVALLKRFYTLQEERVRTYTLFDEGHQAYLRSAPSYNFPMYRQLVHEITQTFKKISDEIIDIENKLRSQHNLPEVAKFVAKVQEEEKLKLETTAKLQIAKQNVIDLPEEISYQEEVVDLKHSLRDICERVTEHLEELKYESEDVVS